MQPPYTGTFAASVPGSCRYRQDFIEQEQLGQGGFGVVVAAINRVDGRKYDAVFYHNIIDGEG